MLNKLKKSPISFCLFFPCRNKTQTLSLKMVNKHYKIFLKFGEFKYLDNYLSESWVSMNPWTGWILQPFQNLEFCHVWKIYKIRKIADVCYDFTENWHYKIKKIIVFILKSIFFGELKYLDNYLSESWVSSSFHEPFGIDSHIKIWSFVKF